jgi:hypothetical protein
MRFQQIADHLRLFVKKCDDSRTKELSSFKTLKSAFEGDIFLDAKVAFFISISKQVEPFLEKFQSAKPMAPFLYCELRLMLRNLMDRFVKPELLQVTTDKLPFTDLATPTNWLPHDKIKVGFETKRIVKNLLSLLHQQQGKVLKV